MSDVRANGSAVNPFERPGPQGVSTEAEKAMKALSLGRVGEFNFNPQDFEATYKRLYSIHKKLQEEIIKVDRRSEEFDSSNPGGDIAEVVKSWKVITIKNRELSANLVNLDKLVCSFLNAMRDSYSSYLDSDSSACQNFTSIKKQEHK
ncbi:hypothetical protein KEM60_02956 [Austwickia sp. TVS 96-490-7B]|uniref:hypothetical protein n=1 Tax=Austwickia sp. TVS 96-490-7B TaxID=2830843 RepID=UPI001C58D2D9|nr:hypothetical protein [Austwickia sp. TVS 96-490-7B]MBW3086727.1 hypothetical protein [Austwickia sp. TVS 96-490-7B]